jgi:CheY-like chemotaxis protein
VETTQPFVTQRHQRLTLALPAERVMVDADPIRLAQVFANLLHNAAKFSGEGRRIDVFVEPQGEVVRVSVRDRGIGIEASDLPRLFDLFKRVRPAGGHDPGGLGIGLTLVKRIVELHGGTVTASSAGPKLGSEFSVQLPVVGAKADIAAAGDSSPTVRHTRLRVLVVDDHEDGATSMCRLLRVLGYEARQASDGLAGVEVAAEFRPNAVLLDIGMPKLNGYDVARRLRAEPWGKKILIVAVTGWGQESDKQRAMESGFDHHLTKPVALTDLTRVLARASAT